MIAGRILQQRGLDYSHDEYKAERIRYIDRWRLEKKDPGAALSEPVKPIVYYIDPSTPTKLVPWIKKGVEDLERGIRSRGLQERDPGEEAPTAKEDPNWSVEDVRNSVIKWIPSTTENAEGPQHFRSSHRRDSERRHRGLSQRVEPDPRLVFRAGGAAGSSRAKAASSG